LGRVCWQGDSAVHPGLNPNSPLTVEFWAKMNFYGVYVPVCSMNQPARDGGYEFYVDGNSAGYEWHSAGAAVITCSRGFCRAHSAHFESGRYAGNAKRI